MVSNIVTQIPDNRETLLKEDLKSVLPLLDVVQGSFLILLDLRSKFTSLQIVAGDTAAEIDDNRNTPEAGAYLWVFRRWNK